MQLPAPAVPRLIRKEEQIHGIAAGVQVRRPLIPTELAQVLPIGVDLMGEEGGLFLQLGHFLDRAAWVSAWGPGRWWWWNPALCTFSAEGHFQIRGHLPSLCKVVPAPLPEAPGAKKDKRSQVVWGEEGVFRWGRVAVPGAGHRGSALAGGHRFQKAPGT